MSHATPARPNPAGAATGVTRRRFVQVGGAAMVGLGAATLASRRYPQTGALLRSSIPAPTLFCRPLPIPKVLTPSSTANGTDTYQMLIHPGMQEMVPGHQTEVWGYAGTFPGPTITARSGRTTALTQINHLPIPVVTHLHGGVTATASDGYPTDLLIPVGTNLQGTASMVAMPGMPGMPADPLASLCVGMRTYTYTNAQSAATLWYHDHRMGFTGPDVWRGLAGFYLIADEVEDALPLPFGERDIPLMITDRSFNADGSLAYPSIDGTLLGIPGVTAPYMAGVLGDVILVNGASWPYLDVERCRYRLRLLNGSNARRYQLALFPPPPGGGAFVQIGSDAGLLPAPIALDTIEMAQAERFDVVVDFSRYQPGQIVTLTNGFGGGNTAKVMQFRIGSIAPDDSSVPRTLAPYRTLRRADAHTTRTFDFADDNGVWKINGQAFDPTAYAASVPADAVELWRFVTRFHHPIHLHTAHFQVLTRNGAQPGLFDAGWKDTVDVLPSEEVEVLVKFPRLSGRYVFHCHNLEHEDMAMMANFKLV